MAAAGDSNDGDAGKMLLLISSDGEHFQCLLDLACDHAAEFIKDMMPEQVRELFGIENDLTPEEEAAIRSENAWAYEI
uniref:SKP1 component dimerisation domain-containing protein n=1 Tax=Oryza brachyantha TaxID=4533 RepID=J3ND28_ORYBR